MNPKQLVPLSIVLVLLVAIDAQATNQSDTSSGTSK
jgi:hypothetical protein